MFSIKNLKTKTLDAVNLNLAAGECVCLTGPSGSGKSLLLRAIADLDPCDADIRINDTSRSKVQPTEWRRQVGLLAAESYWWNSRVGEHFEDCENVTPEELGFTPDVMQWNVERLSSGERQRLGLLRLLCNRPSVLLLDEPTANLDAESRQMVETMILNYVHDTQAAVLWVSHDKEQINRVCRRMLEIKNNTLVESGL
jgi:ABC-type iron transport system FetAB ATPase subunit